VTTKEYGQPVIFFDPTSGYPKWIGPFTEIYLTTFDPLPHPSGVKETQYRVTLVDDIFCEDAPAECENAQGSGDWTVLEGQSFLIDEDSCHLIEYYSVDNVDKVEDVKKQCVYVDALGPEPVKTVGEPKAVWDGTDAHFYDLAERCWAEEDGIDCYRVTMTTPLNLSCVDPDPHPVGLKRLCFNVELDAEDYTEDYCSYYGGNYNATGDGYCCADGEITNFLFKEESEHNLKYYCEDLVGNKGPIDDEKFKVGGTSFEIHLYKKWNLISVPFILLDDNPDSVFGHLEGLESIWTYDSETGEWLSWFPGNETEDSLTQVLPGWGYWAFELLDHEVLTIGGNLLKQGPELPPSKVLMPGWNLIGYYGTGWQDYPVTDDYNFICEAPFDPDAPFVYGDSVYCALGTLIDTTIGTPKWSALWSFVNCGDHHPEWIGLGICPDSGEILSDRMFAGRGYWVEVDAEEIYTPATGVCTFEGDIYCAPPLPP